MPFAVIGFTLFFVLAAFFDASTYTAVIMLIIFTAALLTSIAVEALRKNKVLPVAFATGAAAFALLILFNTFIYAPQMELDGNVYDIKAQLADYPEQKYGKFYYPAKVIDLNGEKVSVKTRIVLNSPAQAAPYDMIEGKFKFYRLGQTSDEILASYKSSGTYLGAFSADGEYRLIYPDKSQKPFMSKVVEFRAFIKESVYRILPNEYGSLAAALILGDRSGLSENTLSSFSGAGITHIICVSGLHLSIWGLFILKILRKIGIGQRLSAGLTVIPVVMLMVITGMNYSVVRSGIMMLVFLLSDILLRRRDSLNSLGFALSVMAVLNPFSMGSVSLQLSTLSTLGIILCSRYVIPDVKKAIDKIKAKPLKRPLSAAAESFLITCSAVVFTLPVAAEMRPGFDFAVFPANFLTVWAAGFAMVFSAVGALIGNISLSVFNLPGLLGGLLCKYIIRAAEFINRFGFLKIRISSEKLYISLLAAIIFAVTAFVISGGKKQFKAVSVSLCSVVFIFSMLVSSCFENSEMRAEAIDTGGGTAVLASYKGRNILIGCSGTDDLTESEIRSAVDDNGGKLDALIVCEEENDLSDDLIEDYSPETVCFTEETDFSVSDDLKIKTRKSGEGYAVLVETNEGSFLVATSPSVDMKALPQSFSEAGVLFSRSYVPENLNKNSLRFAVISAEKVRGELIEKHLAGEGIRCVSTGKKGNVAVRCRSGYYSYSRN